VPLAGVREHFVSLPARRREARRRAEQARGREEDARARARGEPAPAGPGSAGPAHRQELAAYADLAGAALIRPELARHVDRHAELCPDDDLRRILEALVDVRARGEEPNVDRVLAELADHPARHRVVSLVERAAAADDPAELFRGAAGCLERREQEHRIREQIAEIRPDDPEQARLAELHRELRARVI
jgi:hypothetical protein